MIINILEYYKNHPGKLVVLIFLDAQKAFNNVNWQFMLEQLKGMQFGETFINFIQTIYTKQKARIKINGDLSGEIEVEKGTRQGCSISPLLFILALEILCNMIREKSRIKGTRVKNEEYKLFAFADDLVFTLEESDTSI